MYAVERCDVRVGVVIGNLGNTRIWESIDNNRVIGVDEHSWLVNLDSVTDTGRELCRCVRVDISGRVNMSNTSSNNCVSYSSKIVSLTIRRERDYYSKEVLRVQKWRSD